MGVPQTIWIEEDTEPVLIYVLTFRDSDGSIQPLWVNNAQFDWRMKEPMDPDPDAMLTSESGSIVVDGEQHNVCKVQLTLGITAHSGKYRSRLNVIKDGRIIAAAVNPLIIKDF